MNQHVLTSQEPGLCRITLNAPETGNAATDPMAQAIIAAIRGAPGDTRLIVIQANGPDFCVGRAGMAGRSPRKPEALDLRDANDVVFDCYAAIRDTPIPVLAIVRGRAHGFGCAIAGVADVTIASSDSSYRLPEITHRIMPTMVMSALLDRIPPKALSYLVYSAATIDATRALTLGLVSDVVAPAALHDAASGFIAGMLAAPAPALPGTKEFIGRGRFMDIHGAVAFARNLHATVNASSRMNE